MSGMRISATRQPLRLIALLFKNARAESNVSVRKPSDSRSVFRESRTCASSSTMNTDNISGSRFAIEHRKCELKNGSAIWSRFGPKLSAVGLDYGSTNAETNAHAGGFGRRKGLKQAAPSFLRQPRSIVYNGNADHAIASAG